MDGESGTTSPTSADIAEQMGFTNEEPPADEPLALVKRVKVKVEPELDYDKPLDLQQKNDVKRTGTLSSPVLTKGTNVPPNMMYTYPANGIPTIPQLVDLIPSAVNGKSVRPFKAYNANRDLMAGLPISSGLTTYPAVPIALSGPPGAAVPLSVPTVVVSSSSVDAVQTNSNGGSTAHLMTLATEADKLLQKTQDPKIPNGHGKTENGSADEAMTPGSTSGGSDAGSAGDLLEETIAKIKKRAGLAVDETPEQSQPMTISTKKSKKKASCPDQNKDNHYWERRRKNNEAAKRSRDARRAKEDQIAIRAALLEQENIRLRIEMAALKEETVRLKAMLQAQSRR